MKPGIVLFNPRSARWKHRIPNSILQVGASIHGMHDYTFVDGNMEADPLAKIRGLFETGNYRYLCVTVMPGPQLKQAIPVSREIKKLFPEVITIWGGYFPSNQPEVCLNSQYVDYVVNGPGDRAFPKLISALTSNETELLSKIKNLVYKTADGRIIKTGIESLFDQDKLPPLPYDHLNLHYPLRNYLSKTFMGDRTFSYHSSMGCPFTCSFCGIVPIFNAAWKGKSARKMYEDIRYFIDHYGIDAIEFHDNNFFTSRKRVIEFSKLIKNDNLKYWAEGRIDTINRYSDEDLALMKESGCTMIFLGAETGNDEVLKQMNKGGTQTGLMIKEFARRMGHVGIIPEMSFVLGLPAESEKKVYDQILWDIDFIKEIKEINPATEIIIYLYSPVPTEGSELYREIKEAGFSFPETLEEWISPDWENFDLRKNPLTPWLKPYMVDKIRDFETVLNARYPTVSDFRIKGFRKKLIQSMGYWRYHSGFYKYPIEIKLFHKLWKYRQPEIEGFYSE